MSGRSGSPPGVLIGSGSPGRDDLGLDRVGACGVVVILRMYPDRCRMIPAADVSSCLGLRTAPGCDRQADNGVRRAGGCGRRPACGPLPPRWSSRLRSNRVETPAADVRASVQGSRRRSLALAARPTKRAGLDTLAGARCSTDDARVPRWSRSPARFERACRDLPAAPGLDTLAGARYSTNEARAPRWSSSPARYERRRIETPRGLVSLRSLALATRPTNMFSVVE